MFPAILRTYLKWRDFLGQIPRGSDFIGVGVAQALECLKNSPGDWNLTVCPCGFCFCFLLNLATLASRD